MNQQKLQLPTAPYDVLIIGAGLSGIGAARALTSQCPDKHYAILEARHAIGGTWDLFRYPGVRSDSDMYTLSYSFKPWLHRKAIADGPDIRRYIEETAEESGITRHIRFGHKVTDAAWSSEDACWTVTAQVTQADGQTEEQILRTRLLSLCAGYYSYDEAYRPVFANESAFRGKIIHPQFWPQDLDYADKRVVVIGSGATAVTLVPAMAKTAAHVTMLQRSPSYVVSRPLQDNIAQGLQKWLPMPAAHALTRWKNVLVGSFFYRIARNKPEMFKQRILEMARDELGPSIDIRHFTPSYNPWDQRVCAVPDGDLFHDIREGRASVVTDTIDQFTATGIRLASGEEIQADIIVTATGLKLNALGDMTVTVDGKTVEAGQSMAYKGMMLSDIPNFILTFGYTNSSWTLKAELTANYACRLLRYMDRKGYRIAVPRRDPQVLEAPFLDFTSGYVQRAAGLLPRQGDRRPWQVYQNYTQDKLTIQYGRINDGVMQFQ
ncbi:flavin-containing monooxygenase [Pseudomonas profundi]|uniref:flavin-containing monooxygenase n=1 Tax=Pseudomonas profundi TaxID=1981513 RepID=UPI00123BB3E7|nr:NAD(P)/FAD-dependent oxidoreductase [Pseudomonas profundi]